MIVIFENGKITGVEKELLNLIDVDLENLSKFLSLLSLQIASITEDKVELNGFEFKIKQIPLLTTKDLQIFELSSEEVYKEKEESEIPPFKLKDLETEQEVLKPVEESEVFSQMEEASFEPAIKEEFYPEKEQTEEPAYNIKPEEETPGIREEEDFLSAEKEKILQATHETSTEPAEEENTQTEEVVQEENTEEETKPLDVGIKKIENEEEPQEEIKPKDKTIETKEDADIDIEENETEDIMFKTAEEDEGYIVLEFEDDLDEIRKILHLSEQEFNEAIVSELKKASEELGIEYKMLIEWYYQLIDQIKDEKNVIYKNLALNKYDQLHESYHKLKGAALNLRLSKIALVLKKLDELSKNHESIEKIKHLTDDFYKLIESQTMDLNISTEENKQEEKQIKEPEKYVQDIILQTIQSYLNSQNEAQFQKDKKYIEKLLNTKIDSIEDLQNIVKGM